MPRPSFVVSRGHPEAEGLAHMHDVAVEIKGPSARDVATAFAERWNNERVGRSRNKQRVGNLQEVLPLRGERHKRAFGFLIPFFLQEDFLFR